MNVGAIQARLREAVSTGWLLYLAAAVLSRLAGLFLVPFYTRQLSTDEYGAYALLTSLLAFLPMSLTLGLSGVASKAFFEQPNPERGREQMVRVGRLMAAMALGLGASLAMMIGALWPDSLLGVTRYQVLLILLSAVGHGLGYIPETYFRVARRVRLAVAQQLFVFLGTAGLGILFVVWWGRGLDGAIEALAVVAICNACIAGWFLGARGGMPPKAELMAWLAVSVPLVAHSVSSWLMAMGDRWVLATAGSVSELGTYYLAVQLVSPVAMLASTWNDVDAPSLGESYRAGGLAAARATLGRRVVGYAVLSAAAALAVGLVVPLSPILIGPRFLPALGYLPLLMLAAVIDSMYFAPANLLLYAGRTRSIPMISTVVGLGGIGLAFAMMAVWGVFGLLLARLAVALARSAWMAAVAWSLDPEPSAAPATSER